MQPVSLGKKAAPYIFLVMGAGIIGAIASASSAVQEAFARFPEGLYLSIALIFAIGYGSSIWARKTVIPSFVLAILFGIILQPIFRLLTSDLETLSIINEFLAALILFGSGVEMPWKNFKKHFAPVASLAFFGMILSVFLFALILEQLGVVFGIEIPSSSFLLIGAILAAVEPSAIIPVFKHLRFKKPEVRDLAIAEGAVNDVTGTVITRFFLVATLAITSTTNVVETFTPLFKREHFNAFALEILWGVLVGVIGAWVLKRWYQEGKGTEKSNPALFFAVPIFSYALGGLIGGSGFLAAFVAGLLYQSSTKTRSVHHFFDVFNSTLIIPVIFVLLGAVIPLEALLATAGIGIVAALLFMFVVRPVVVFLSLFPWLFRERPTVSWQDLVFLSFIRETGGISAVLILVVAGKGVGGAEYIFGIGFWVIFLTLVIEPPLTPWLTKKLGIAEAA